MMIVRHLLMTPSTVFPPGIIASHHLMTLKVLKKLQSDEFNNPGGYDSKQPNAAIWKSRFVPTGPRNKSVSVVSNQFSQNLTAVSILWKQSGFYPKWFYLRQNLIPEIGCLILLIKIRSMWQC